MALVSSILGGASAIRAESGSGGNSYAVAFKDFWQDMKSVSGIQVTPHLVKSIAAAMACVDIISRNVATFPCKLYRDRKDGGKEIASNNPLYGLIYTRPNERMTAFEFKQMMQTHVELRGNAFAEIVPGRRGAVDQLLPMHPDRVRVEVLSTGRMRYNYNDPLTGNTRVLVQEEVFHLRNKTEDGYVGQSTIQTTPDAYAAAYAAQDYSSRFFQNDGKPSGIISGGMFKSPEDEEKFREKWQRWQTGANRHKTAIMLPGMEYKPIGIAPDDMQVLDARKFSRIEICSLYGVPPHLIGETEKAATYASVEQFNIMFATQCLLPRLVMWEQAINRDLIIDPAVYSKFSMGALLRGDTASRYAAYQIAIQNGWMCQNDVRLLEDLNPIDEGGNYWRPLNWAPLGQLTPPPTANTVAGPDPDDGDDANNDGATQDASTQANLQILKTIQAGAQR